MEKISFLKYAYAYAVSNIRMCGQRGFPLNCASIWEGNDLVHCPLCLLIVSPVRTVARASEF